MRPARWGYVARTLGARGTRIQLCGRLVVELDGRRLEDELPGRQGRLLFARLATSRGRPVRRDALAELLWPGDPPGAHDGALRPLLSRLRQVLGERRCQGRSELRLVLPPDAIIDTEQASAAVHDAEAAIALGRFHEAWLPARLAWSVTSREFMLGLEGEWVDDWRRSLSELRLRALDAIARTGLELGPAELGAAERAGRALTEEAPYRESGYRFLMEALERRGDLSEALRTYERLRCTLRDELGTVPGAEVQAVHTRLLSRA